MAWPFVEVFWRDAIETSRGWVRGGLLEPPPLVHSRGWLVKQTDNFVVLCASMDPLLGEEGEITQVMTIPVSMMEGVYELRTTRKKVKQNADRTQHHVHPEPPPEAVHREPGQG